MQENTGAWLHRFIEAQQPIYEQVLEELRAGQKRGHWMWFIFPQIISLGNSETSRYYAIEDLEHARQYLQHPLLGSRLQDCAEAILEHAGCDASTIFPYPDDLKLQSSMTLFSLAAETDDSVFDLVLEEFYKSDQDMRTLEILGLL